MERFNELTTILTRKQLKKILITEQLDSTMKIQESMISGQVNYLTRTKI